jgi:hypothetical protein
VVTSAQNLNAPTNELLLPSKEKFREATDLTTPWRSSGCRVFPEFQEANCYQVTVKEYRSSDILTLYNEDGSVWYRFSLTFQSPEYFLRNTKKGFLPFSTDHGFLPEGTMEFGKLFPPQIVILRMVRESQNWYEVEINEETKATKFILKSDPMWAITTWSYWLYEGVNFTIDSKKLQIRDKPKGKVIEETTNLDLEKVKFLKADGDWAYVQASKNQTIYRGWIQWRDGRNILVGNIFNHYKIPQ